MSAPSTPAGALTLCRLWKRWDHEGTLFMSGTLGGLRVLLIPNKDRADLTDAEYVLVLADNKASRKPKKEIE